MKNLIEEMEWNEFYYRYTQNFEEFSFRYKHIIITLCYGKNGAFAYNIVENKKVIEYKEYSSPFELLEKARFCNLRFKDIYSELF